MNIEYKNPNDLLPYARNSKLHPKDQIDKIARQIDQVGFLVPVIVDKDNVIITGHGRTLAAKALGLDKIPTLKLENLTEEQVNAFRIADNKVSESNWDLPALAFELGTLERLNIDLTLTGFDLAEVKNILSSFNGTELRPGVESGENNPTSEWTGMPEFDHVDKTSEYRVIVHFASKEDLDAFSNLIDQKLTENTRSIWFPKAEIERAFDKSYEQSS